MSARRRLVHRIRIAMAGALLAPLVMAAVLLGASYMSIPAGAVTAAGSLLHVRTTIEVGGVSVAHDTGGTLFVVPDNQVLTYGDALPDYTFTLHSGAANGPAVSPTLATPPVCSSPYDGSWSVGSYPTAISCSGGSDPAYSFDTTSTAGITINQATLYVVPDALVVRAHQPAPPFTFSFHLGSPSGPVIPVDVATPPTCSAPYATTLTQKSPPVVITCSGGADPNYAFDTSSSAPLTIGAPILKPQAPLVVTPPSTGIAGIGDPLVVKGGSGSHRVVLQTSTPECAIKDGQVVYLGAKSVATCVVTATNPQNGDYKAATSKPFTVTIGSLAGLQGQHVTTRFCGPPGVSIIGCRVTLTITGFPGQLPLSAWVDGLVGSPVAATTDGSGTATISLVLPSSLMTGEHVVSVGLISGDHTSVGGSEQFSVVSGQVLGHIGPPPSGPLGQFVQYLPSQHRKEILATAVGTVAAVGAAAGAMGGAGGGSSGGGTGSSEGGVSGETGNLAHSSIASYIQHRAIKVEAEAALFAPAVMIPSQRAPGRIAYFSPMIGRISVDGEYLRAFTGHVWLSLLALAAALGVTSAVSTHFDAIPPTTVLFGLILALGILDAWFGFTSGLTFILLAAATGHIRSFSEIRLAAGIMLVWFTIPLAAGTVRPLRRYFQRTLDGIWNHAADVVVAGLFGAWVTEKLISNLSSVSGVELPIVKEKYLMALVSLVVITVRIVLESYVLMRLPDRLAAMHHQGDLRAPAWQQLLSLTLQMGLLLFFAQALLGTSWALFVGTAIYFSPLLPKPFAHRLPKSRRIAKLVPVPVFKYSTVVLIGAAISIVLQLTVHSTSTLERVAFIVLPLPTVFFWHINLWAAPKSSVDAGAPVSRWRQSPWLLRIGGTLLFTSAVFVVLNHVGA